MASPPSFDSFYSSQQRSSTLGSMDNYPSNTYTSSSDQFGAIYAQQLGDEPQGMVMDEPQSMVTDEPQSMAPPPGGYARAHPLAPNTDVERKDSVPFDPQTSSTLIASVQSQTVSPQPSPGFPSPYDQQYQQQHQQQQQQQYGQFSQHSTPAYATTPDFSPHRGDAGMFAQQQEATPVDHEANSRRASWNGAAAQDANHELQRVASTQGSNPGSPAPDHHSPGVASPFDHPSTEHVRSPSPYGAPIMGAPSPPVHGMHRSSAANSPSFSKPQSPPALVIPNSSAPSPSLPGIMAQTAPQAQASANGGPQGGQFGNSLFPPTNPALEHLTGMAGISPIAPNADGPMICIQPSTPISGLKEGGGVFDAALRRANADNLRNSATQQQSQANGGGAQGVPATVGQQGPGGQSPGTFARDAREWTQRLDLSNIDAATRRRTKSESYTSTDPTFDRTAFAARFMEQPTGTYTTAFSPGFDVNMNPPNTAPADPWRDINTWRMQAVEQSAMTVDPRALPGSEAVQHAQHAQQQHEQQQQQLHEMQEQQRARVQQFNQSHPTQSGRFSPTSMAFYEQLGLSPGNAGGQPVSEFPGAPHSSYLAPGSSGPVRRRSFAEGTVQHHATGAGTPGYGVEFNHNGAITPPARYRGQYLQSGGGGRHARASRSEDFGRPTGWGMGAGGSTTDFLQSIINPSDGTLLPPSMRGRSMSQSRHSSASSARSASPALSISSQGSGYSHHSHMEMPEGVQLERFQQQGHDPRAKSVAKMKVTSMATEVASQSRRTNSPIFQCPIPGCGSTFTRHFNLKGHMRSHNDERPYKCLYEGCPKSIVGFARQHDCKRHMLLHGGVKPFECDGCGKQFARLDALTRHHKSEQGQECAVSHPLPVNPDGSPMSESQYKAYRLEKLKREGKAVPPGLTTRADSSRSGDVSANVSADEREDVKPDL